MQTEIGDFDPATRTVPVTFTLDEQVHTRPVNACLDEGGDYDPVATASRVADVGRGVARKFDLGVFVEPAPLPAPDEDNG